MKSLDIADANGSLAEYARLVCREPVIVTQGGKPIAALVPIEGTDWETLSLGTNPDFLALIAQSRTRDAEEAGISPDEMRRFLGLDPGK